MHEPSTMMVHGALVQSFVEPKHTLINDIFYANEVQQYFNKAALEIGSVSQDRMGYYYWRDT